MSSLVIVESPAKAATIQKYLGNGFVVESSIGHIRDLAVPSQLEKDLRKSDEYINAYAVDVSNDFAPIYLVSPDRKSHITTLKKLLKGADELLLATDEDREGESIAWHLLEVLKPKVPVRRMVFHEITPKAIQAAVDTPRDIDQHLVDAQEARRILDRLYGFAMSTVVRQRSRGPSAGRVQSVATRVVVERERERIAFRKAFYWDLQGVFKTEAGKDFEANLVRVDGKRIASGRDFGQNGILSSDQVHALDESAAKALAEALKSSQFEVGAVESKPYRRKPAAPFMTSTLQQEAGRKLGFGASRAMSAAQGLYEKGYITYMRTDSTTLSQTALDAARRQIKELYEPEDLPDKPRMYARKVKNAQEAHEAIRPAGDEFRTPAQVARELAPHEARLYELIWKRTIASQMEDAQGQTVTLRLKAKAASGEEVEFSVSGTTITKPGFLKAYVEGSDDPAAELDARDKHLPPLEEGQKVASKSLTPNGHETQPPSRYTEASLVKWLEERGIGRPSTYAAIMSVIQDRGYVWRKGTALVPTWKAFQVVRLLEDHFGHLVDYDFTARMEDDLDAIANGDAERGRWLAKFFFGDEKSEGLEKLVVRKMADLSPGTETGLEEIRRLEAFDIGKDAEGRAITLRMGKHGPYLSVDAEEKITASVPDNTPPDELTEEAAREMLEAPKGDRELGLDPESGETVYLKAGRYGAYVQVGSTKDRKDKPKTASILKSMDPETMTLDDALKVLSLPRIVGTSPEGEEIQALNGRYGPYIVKGKDNRSLEREEQIFSVTVAEAMALFAQPKQRGRAAAKPPLRELGNDPVSEKPIVLKEGRFGLYVTDGETNASLRTGDDGDTLTPERAQELLQMRRDKGPGKKKRATKKKAAKKTTKKAAKKTTKKAAKKKSTKKAAKKKSTKKAAKSSE